MAFFLLFSIIIILAAFTSKALKDIDQLKLRVEELEHDAGYGNF